MRRTLSAGVFALALGTTAHAGETADIFDAARDGDVAAIHAYKAGGGDVNAVNEDGYTPFILAAYHQRNAALVELKADGGDACATDGKGSNALMGVAFQGYADTAAWLLDNTSCGVDHRNRAGQTALMMASLFGREDVIRLLLAKGADPRIADNAGNTAQSLAEAQGLTKVAKMVGFVK